MYSKVFKDSEASRKAWETRRSAAGGSKSGTGQKASAPKAASLGKAHAASGFNDKNHQMAKDAKKYGQSYLKDASKYTEGLKKAGFVHSNQPKSHADKGIPTGHYTHPVTGEKVHVSYDPGSKAGMKTNSTGTVAGYKEASPSAYMIHQAKKPKTKTSKFEELDQLQGDLGVIGR